MQFGLFGTVQASSNAPGTNAAEGFHRYIDFNVEAEELGFCSSFLVEHHFTGFAQVSATLNVLTWLAARTSRLRVGTAVMVLPWHNPVLLAEQAATLDLLSGGRLDLGIGKGYRFSEFHGFSLSMDEAEARFDEALDVMIRAWTCRERFSHHGRFWRFDDIIVEPPPAQVPHPRLWMAAGSPQSIRRVAERGCNLLLDQFASVEVIGERIALYRAEVEARGRQFDPFSVAVARDVVVVDSAAERAAALERNALVRQRIIDVAKAPGRDGGSHVLAYANDASTNEAALIETPEAIAVRIEDLRRAGARYLLTNFWEDDRESLRRFARDIAPTFTRS